MKNQFIKFILLLTFPSCTFYYHNTAPRNIKERFKFLYEERNTGIDSLLNINGYFDLEPRIEESGFINFERRLFFIDGICVIGILDYNEKRFYNGRENITELFKEIARNDSLGVKSYFYKDLSWGNYFLSGDTIKIQSVSRPELFEMDRSWGASESWFKIIDRNTIVRIYFRKLDEEGGTLWEIGQKEENGRVNYPLKFFPTSVLPTSDGWIKKEKWFWKDEQKYREYLNKIRKGIK